MSVLLLLIHGGAVLTYFLPSHHAFENDTAPTQQQVQRKHPEAWYSLIPFDRIYSLLLIFSFLAHGLLWEQCLHSFSRSHL
jgi:hypothetical protein